jgi:hypothetical protein
VAEEPLDLAAQETGEPDLLDFGLLGCAKPPRTAVGQADDAGVHSGVSTAVEWRRRSYTIPALKHYIADRALTDIRCKCDAANQRDELAAPHLITTSAKLVI